MRTAETVKLTSLTFVIYVPGTFFQPLFFQKFLNISYVSLSPTFLFVFAQTLSFSYGNTRNTPRGHRPRVVLSAQHPVGIAC